MSYSIETIIAEKLHAIIVHGALTTRLKDYYDMYILIKGNVVTFNKQTLIMAIENTFQSLHQSKLFFLSKIIELVHIFKW